MSIFKQLTPRQNEVLELAAQGYSNNAIAERLVIQRRTIERHFGEIYLRLGVSTYGEMSGARRVVAMWWSRWHTITTLCGEVHCDKSCYTRVIGQR